MSSGPLKEAKDAVRTNQREIREAISAGEWGRAAILAYGLAERLDEVAALERGE